MTGPKDIIIFKALIFWIAIQWDCSTFLSHEYWAESPVTLLEKSVTPALPTLPPDIDPSQFLSHPLSCSSLCLIYEIQGLLFFLKYLENVFHCVWPLPFLILRSFSSQFLETQPKFPMNYLSFWGWGQQVKFSSFLSFIMNGSHYSSLASSMDVGLSRLLVSQTGIV